MLAALWFTSQSDLRITRTGLHSVKLSNKVLFGCAHWELLLHHFLGPDGSKPESNSSTHSVIPNTY